MRDVCLLSDVACSSGCNSRNTSGRTCEGYYSLSYYRRGLESETNSVASCVDSLLKMRKLVLYQVRDVRDLQSKEMVIEDLSQMKELARLALTSHFALGRLTCFVAKATTKHNGFKHTQGEHGQAQTLSTPFLPSL